MSKDRMLFLGYFFMSGGFVASFVGSNSSSVLTIAGAILLAAVYMKGSDA
jgi:hypothetical protein